MPAFLFQHGNITPPAAGSSPTLRAHGFASRAGSPFPPPLSLSVRFAVVLPQLSRPRLSRPGATRGEAAGAPPGPNGVHRPRSVSLGTCVCLYGCCCRRHVTFTAEVCTRVRRNGRPSRSVAAAVIERRRR